MEDLSRDLEKELAQVKPKPYQPDRRTRVIIVDDFGRMTSGEYLKKLVKVLTAVGVICFIMAVVFCQLYFGLAKDTKAVKSQLVIAKDKINKMAAEKEVLMARLVISGKDSMIQKDQPVKPSKKNPPVIKKTAPKKNTSKLARKTPIVAKKPEIKSQIDNIVQVKKNAEKKDEASQLKPASEVAAESSPKPQPDVANQSEAGAPEPKTVSIDKFTVTKDGGNGDLLVRFDIRNTSKTPGDVSGRIFTLLKPEDDNSAQWLIVPSVGLKDGIPSEYRKGQYFSIAHFKPVKFRIKNNQDPNLYKKASIFIFNNKGKLIFKKLIDITGAN